MSSIFLKFAQKLSDTEVIKLFQDVAEQTSWSEASNLCGITRRSAYKWVEGGYIKPESKEKVLNAALSINFENTIDYLIDTFKSSSNNIITSLLSNIYQSIMTECISGEQLEEKYYLFCNFIIKYSDSISVTEPPVYDMYLKLSEKAQSDGISNIPLPIESYKASDIVDFIPYISRIQTIDKSEPQAISIKYDIPLKLIQEIYDLKMMFLPKNMGSLIESTDMWMQDNGVQNNNVESTLPQINEEYYGGLII